MLTPREKALWLFGGILALLVVASSVGWLLARRAKTDSGRATVENLVARVNAWWVMVILLAIAFALGKTATVVLFAFVSFFALREFITLTPTRQSDYLPLLLASAPPVGTNLSKPRCKATSRFARSRTGRGCAG